MRVLLPSGDEMVYNLRDCLDIGNDPSFQFQAVPGFNRLLASSNYTTKQANAPTSELAGYIVALNSFKIWSSIPKQQVFSKL